MSFRTLWFLRVVCSCAPLVVSTTAWAGPYAASVTGFSQGAGGNPAFADPNSALGEPARMTGFDFSFPGVVSMFNPPFDSDQIVSIGRGGSLTVQFDEPITNDPSHLYGMDLIVFGNAGFIDSDFPNGHIGSPAGLFGADNAQVELSSDGINFFAVSPTADSLFPTQGYLDSGPFDVLPGNVPSDFLKPMNPALGLSSFNGLTFAQAMALYDGSGGGTPIDIAEAGLSSVSYVRISVALNAAGPAEIDAFAAVPEPTSGLLCLLSLALVGRRRTSAQRP
jgi:hypothetical protein